MNCVRVLKKLYRLGNKKAGHIIHDLQLWAGAYVIDPKKRIEERMRAAYQASVVNGTFVNLHSVKDYVLSKVFQMIHPNQVPVGCFEILTDIEADDQGEKGYKNVINYDVKTEAGGHLGYKQGCLSFFPRI